MIRIPTIGGLIVALASPAMAGDMPARFTTPQEALDAVVAALDGNDRQADLLAIFSDDAEDVLSTGNPERDAENAAEIRALIAEDTRFRFDNTDQVTLLLGTDGWPFPIPISRRDGAWAFDLDAGRDEIHFRRIGENELHAIDVMAAYVDIQLEYRLTDHDRDGVMEFAATILSSPGEQDGLFWQQEDGPLGDRIARASLDGYNDGETDQAAEPYGGYYYRILHGQGAAAPGGAMDYRINGQMVAGHALLAVPSDYGVTGIHSFMVAENGVILQADLGEDSLNIAFDMRLFDPGDGWAPAQ
ncbi:MAG: DUF2950 family protein [Marinibacterium sp.]